MAQLTRTRVRKYDPKTGEIDNTGLRWNGGVVVDGLEIKIVSAIKFPTVMEEKLKKSLDLIRGLYEDLGDLDQLKMNFDEHIRDLKDAGVTEISAGGQTVDLETGEVTEEQEGLEAPEKKKRRGEGGG